MQKRNLLTRLLLLFAFIVGSTSVWAQEETITSFSAPAFYGGTTNGWSVNNPNYQTGGGGYYLLATSTASIVTPEIIWTNYTDIKITITARKYGGPDATQGKIEVKQNSTTLAEYSPTGTSLVASGALSILPSSGVITICCPGASSNKGCGISAITITGTPSATPIPSINAEDIEITYNATNGSIAYTITNEVEGGQLTATCTSGSDWLTIGNISDDAVAFTNTANTGDVRTATVELKYTYTDGTEQSVTKEVAVTQGTVLQEIWVATKLEDLTADDVFVIVGTKGSASFAMPNDGGDSNPPSAVTVTVNDNKLTGEVADNIKWTVNSTTEGYMFYPNGSTDTWLYCKYDDNNGVRVGTGDAKHFTLTTGDSDPAKNGYLTTSEAKVQRYIGIYNSQDWRCYTSINTNISGQTFAFYKKMKVTSVAISSAKYATFVSDATVDFSETGITAYAAKDEGNYVSLTEIKDNKVPAKTPVVLYKEDADGSVIDVPVIADIDLVVDNNDLQVSTGTDVDNMYVLADKTNGVGFYKWAGTTPLSEGKVYLQGKTAGARDFLGFDNETTGISTTLMNNEAKNKEFYNLAGQRVAQPTKGLYIVNGKKVIIK